MLEIKGVTRRFGEFVAVDQLSLTVQAGEFFTLLGPSGCGKTTLLRMLAGFEQPDAGQILLDGQDLTSVPPERRPIHTIFQSYALFPHLTVADNVGFALRMAGVPKAEIRRRVAEQLEAVHLSGLDKRYPSELSGGQRQRVAVARALINRPRILLLDEPLAALDLKLREQMQLELVRLQREVGIAFVYVTHDQSEALALSQRVAVMNRGRIEQLDPPRRLYALPRNRFVADFIGSCNLLDAEVRAIRGNDLLLAVDGIGELLVPRDCEAWVGQRGALALRPEQLRLSLPGEPAPGDVALDGLVDGHLYLGHITSYQIATASGARLEVQRANGAPGLHQGLDRGAAVRVSWPREAGRFLPE